MSGELWGIIICSAVLVIGAVALISHRAEQKRLNNLRTITGTLMFLRRCLDHIGRIPDTYLPNSVRHAVTKAVNARVAEAAKADPAQTSVKEYQVQINEILSKSVPADTPPEPLAPDVRRDVRNDLRGVQRIVVEASLAGSINQEEKRQADSILSILISRLLVDHLKFVANNAENLRKLDEAISHYERVVVELDKLNAPNVAEEKQEILGHMQRLRESLANDEAASQAAAAQALEESMNEDGLLRRADHY